MKRNYAFLLMGAEYDPDIHCATFETPKGTTVIQTVRDFEGAKGAAIRLRSEGVGAIELCGAFSAEMAEELTKLTDRKVAIGYVTHDPALDNLFAAFFGG